MPAAGWGILLLTAAVSMVWSAHKLLEQDEIFSLQTDRVSSLAEVLRIQRAYPISLEPPVYHVLAHGAMQVFGAGAFALRLPALAGYLVMQFCLYFFVRNLVGGKTAERAGLAAMLVPALAWTLFYAAEGRPYGVLLGAYAAAAVCWQMAARQAARGRRLWALGGLASALVLAVHVHFYGVLLLVPICGAELVRSVRERRVDGGVLGAIGVGMASVAATLPYVKASGEFKKHYYAGPISAHMLTQPYRQTLVNYTSFPHWAQLLTIGLLAAGAAVVLWSCARRVQAGDLAAGAGDWTLLLLLVAMPVFAFVLGKGVTHALEVRHSIGAVVGISALIAVALLPVLRQRGAASLLLLSGVVAVVVINGFRVRASMQEARATMAALTLRSEVRAALDSAQDRNVYFQNLGEWETASLYEPDAGLRDRLVLVYSREEEMRHEQHDTMFLTATHTERFSALPIMAYDELRKRPGMHLFVVYPASGWDWTSAAFAQESTEVRPVGKGFGGDVVKVQFKQ